MDKDELLQITGAKESQLVTGQDMALMSTKNQDEVLKWGKALNEAGHFTDLSKTRSGVYALLIVDEKAVGLKK